MKAGLESYQAVVQARRQGLPPQVDEHSTLPEIKPEFYFDGRSIIRDVLGTLVAYRSQHPPYGLVDYRGNTLHSIDPARQPWKVLEEAMSDTVSLAFDETVPSLQACPYHVAFKNTTGYSVRPVDHNEYGLDDLRELTVPGGRLAPTLIVNLMRRMPAMARLNGSSASIVDLARNSERSLLTEPLGHPQQHARAFMFTLGDGSNGTDFRLDRSRFMPDEVINKYTRLDTGPDGAQRIEWALSTEDFILRASVRVPDRTQASTFSPRLGDAATIYPIGTRLGDIAVTEPTIGCPGNQMAYYMWQQAAEVASAENLWT